MDLAWWVAFGAVSGALVMALTMAVLDLPWPRERTMHLTAVLPYPREQVWRAWMSDKRMLTPNRTFENVSPGEEIEIATRPATEDDEVCRVRLSVIAAKEAEVFAARHLGWNGEPSPEDPSTCEAVLLADAPQGTRVTLLINVVTPTLGASLGMGPALDHAMDRLRRDLGMPVEPRGHVLART